MCIRDRLQAGKGAGYARWAKVFNIKQMAQTLNYLSEHGLLDYADLETKTAEATARYNALSDQIKAAEKRMAEIAAVSYTHLDVYKRQPARRSKGPTRCRWAVTGASLCRCRLTLSGRSICSC